MGKADTASEQSSEGGSKSQSKQQKIESSGQKSSSSGSPRTCETPEKFTRPETEAVISYRSGLLAMKLKSIEENPSHAHENEKRFGEAPSPYENQKHARMSRNSSPRKQAETQQRSASSGTRQGSTQTLVDPMGSLPSTPSLQHTPEADEDSGKGKGRENQP